MMFKILEFGLLSNWLLTVCMKSCVRSQFHKHSGQFCTLIKFGIAIWLREMNIYWINPVCKEILAVRMSTMLLCHHIIIIKTKKSTYTLWIEHSRQHFQMFKWLYLKNSFSQQKSSHWINETTSLLMQRDWLRSDEWRHWWGLYLMPKWLWAQVMRQTRMWMMIMMIKVRAFFPL